MSNIRKVHVIGHSSHYSCWMNAKLVERMEDADFVVFTGGEDVGPYLYGKRPHFTTHYNFQRDQYEVEQFKKAQALGLPMLGICRGAQFLCVMSKGILVQDQDNPAFIHKIETSDGKTLITSSTHHQAQYPWVLPPEDFKLLAWSKGASPYHFGETDKEELVLEKAPEDKECEIVYYPRTKCLGIQGHPEMLFDKYNSHDGVSEFIDYCGTLLDGLLAGTL